MKRQTSITEWCRPYFRSPGRDGAGPHASRGPAQATGSSANLTVGGKQSRTTDSERNTQLRIAQWNAEGVQHKKRELQKFLHDNKIDAICIQESHLKSHLRFFVRGYNIFRHDREDRHKGGILTLVKNSIPAVEINKPEGTSHLEHQTIKLLHPDGDLQITNLYSPPATSMALNQITVGAAQYIILGDFNSHSPSWGYRDQDSRGEEVEDWMTENSLILINKPDDKPTCYSRAWKTTSTPDLAMATDNIHKRTEREVCDQLGGSDHLPVILTISKQGYRCQSTKPSWNIRKGNWKQFSAETDKQCKRIELTQCLNKNVHQFTNVILEAAKFTIPRGKRKIFKPYWSNTMDILHKELNTARQEMEKDPSVENIRMHSEKREAFDKQKVKEVRQRWHERTSALNMEDTGKLWNLTKMLNEDSRPTHSATVLIEGNQHHSGKQAADILANHYKDASTTTISPSRQQEVRQEIREQLKHQEPSPPMTEKFTMTELTSALRKLKKGKSPGKDTILNTMLKNLGPTAKEALLYIFNQSWTYGKLPEKWREAIIIPIRKKGKDKTNKSSYRPISLLSCLGKVMERMVNARLLRHLEMNNLLNNCQSAYRKNRSTEDQLEFLSQEIENALQEKKKTLAVFIDLTQAFDKVWKEGLLLKLLRKRVGGNMYHWIKDFLQHRTARVKLDGKMSRQIPLHQGVPQGSVISPTLFLIFIDDIADSLANHISRALHADDFAAWHSAEYLSTARCRMQEALNNINTWANNWGVQINTTKTVSTVFSLSNQKEQAKLTINNKEIEQDDTPKYLGVRFDKRLTWNPHIQEVEGKAIKKMSIMRKLSGTNWGADGKILKRVYASTVRPTIEYGSTAWTTAAKTNKKRLDKVQNSGLRIISGGLKTTPVHIMEDFTTIQPLETRRQEKLFTRSEKILRMPTHPMHTKVQEPTKNRLKRTSFNHISKELHKDHPGLLPDCSENREMLQNYESPGMDTVDINIITEVDGIHRKDLHNPPELKAHVLEMNEKYYNKKEWNHVYTDGSSESAVKNGGAGFHIKLVNGEEINKALPTGKISSNFRAEATALLEATDTLLNLPGTMEKVVIFCDCKSLLQSLQNNSRNEQHIDRIQRNLNLLSQKSSIVIQWIPSHCGIQGNETADALSKEGSKLEQPNHQVSFSEARTIVKSIFRKPESSKRDPIHDLTRTQQTTIFRLRTGHCRLLGHLGRIGISHTTECLCGTGIQTVEHILQHCPNHQTLRIQTWPTGADLETKLNGQRQDLELTTHFIRESDFLV